LSLDAAAAEDRQLQVIHHASLFETASHYSTDESGNYTRVQVFGTSYKTMIATRKDISALNRT